MQLSDGCMLFFGRILFLLNFSSSAPGVKGRYQLHSFSTTVLDQVVFQSSSYWLWNAFLAAFSRGRYQ